MYDVVFGSVKPSSPSTHSQYQMCLSLVAVVGLTRHYCIIQCYCTVTLYCDSAAALTTAYIFLTLPVSAAFFFQTLQPHPLLSIANDISHTDIPIQTHTHTAPSPTLESISNNMSHHNHPPNTSLPPLPSPPTNITASSSPSPSNAH